MQLVESTQDFKLHALSEEFLCCFGVHGKLEFQHSLSLSRRLLHLIAGYILEVIHQFSVWR